MSQETKGKSVIEEFQGERSKKNLKCSVEATAHQKDYLSRMRERQAQGEPIVWNWGTPLELLNSMDVLYIQSVNYSAILSAKQMSRYYLDKLNTEGYFRDLCRYCTVPLGYAFDKKPEIAPWGGLPKFTAAIIERQDDPLAKIWELYAREFDVPLYIIDYTYPTHIPPMEAWWEEQRETDSEVESYRVEQKLEDYKGLIRFLETNTGRAFSETRLRETMDMANKMTEYYWKATDLIAETVPMPVSLTDGLANVPAYLWFRGTEWGVEHGKKYYEEVKERVDKGIAACPNEKYRLMWVFPPIWFSLGFYNTWEEKYGAVFVPSNYIAGAERNIRRNLEEPLKALASRATNNFLDRIIPTTGSRWLLHQVRKFQVKGAVFLVAESCKLNYCKVIFNRQALETAGFPTLELVADMVDARDWDDTKMKSLVTSFIETLST